MKNRALVKCLQKVKVGYYAMNKQVNLSCAEVVLKTIGISAFERCEGLEIINLPASIEVIEDYAFLECKSLKALSYSAKKRGDSYLFELPTRLKKLGTASFSGCSAISYLQVHKNVSEITPEAFSYCEGLVTVVMELGVQLVAKKAFYNCTSLTSVKLSDSIACMQEHAFSACYCLSQIIIPRDLKVLEHAVFRATGLNKVTIPKNVKLIKNMAFAACIGLIEVKLLSAKTILDNSSFYHCTHLKTVKCGRLEKDSEELRRLIC